MTFQRLSSQTSLRQPINLAPQLGHDSTGVMIILPQDGQGTRLGLPEPIVRTSRGRNITIPTTISPIMMSSNVLGTFSLSRRIA